jgi:hypothetical protein
MLHTYHAHAFVVRPVAYFFLAAVLVARTGERMADLTADFKVERTTLRIMLFNAEAPFFEVITLFTISFSFLSFIFSNDVTSNETAFLLVAI